MILARAVEQLKGQVLRLAALVEEHLGDAIRAVTERDAELARKAIEGDDEVDQFDVDIEEECLKLLALHQPMATDLRFIVAVIKLTADLERIGDLATDIAERAEYLSRHDPVPLPEPLPGMAADVRAMLARAIDALVHLDVDEARQVCAADDRVDRAHRQMFRLIEDAIRKQPERTSVLLPLLSVSRYLERTADHATNIAEDVIYLVEGEIVRHSRRAIEAPVHGSRVAPPKA